MSRARTLKRQSQGFASLCSTVRVSGPEGLDRVVAGIVNDLPRPTPAVRFLAELRRWVRGTPRDTLTGWVRRVGTGPAGAR